jgi:hypothetical protein
MTPLEGLRWERRRKLQVREAFSAGLARYRTESGEPRAFYLACADYLLQGQHRLVAQDMRLAEMLKARVAAEQAADHELIDALLDRLQQAQHATNTFATAVDEYRASSGQDHAAFETAAAQYLHVIVDVLGARSHSLRHLTTTLFSNQDWARIVDITPEFLSAEEGLFKAVQRAAEEGLDPDSFSATRPTSGS